MGDDDVKSLLPLGPMSKARDLVNAHLYPVLATFSVAYFAVQIAPIAQQAREFNACVQRVNSKSRYDYYRFRPGAVSYCNGGSERMYWEGR